MRDHLSIACLASVLLVPGACARSASPVSYASAPPPSTPQRASMAVAGSRDPDASMAGGVDAGATEPGVTVEHLAPDASTAPAAVLDGRPIPQPAAERRGRTVTLRSVCASFELPDEWIDGSASPRNVYAGDRLAEVRDGGGEWDTEFAATVNAALPFARCAMHAGQEPFGRDAVSYGDLQMRAYVLAESPEVAGASVATAGASVLQRIARLPVTIYRDDRDAWSRIVIGAQLWFGDYGAPAYVDVRLRRFGASTVALVFMHTDTRTHAPAIRAVLASVAQCATSGGRGD